MFTPLYLFTCFTVLPKSKWGKESLKLARLHVKTLQLDDEYVMCFDPKRKAQLARLIDTNIEVMNDEF